MSAFKHLDGMVALLSEVYETPFREMWMRNGCQLFDPLAKL